MGASALGEVPIYLSGLSLQGTSSSKGTWGMELQHQAAVTELKSHTSEVRVARKAENQEETKEATRQ